MVVPDAVTESSVATQSIEDYIKAIFQLGGDGKPVQTSSIAERLDVRPASVSNMMRRLAKLALIDYAPYRGARLTEEGQILARRMVRRHRLIERFLTEVLDYPWEEVHDEAERLEHAVSARFVEAIDYLLERPETDPHGAPIPGRDGRMVEQSYPTLAELEPGEHAVVRRVRDSDASLLRFLREVGIQPDVKLEVLERGEDEGQITVQVAGRRLDLARNVSSGVFVERVPPKSQ